MPEITAAELRAGQFVEAYRKSRVLLVKRCCRNAWAGNATPMTVLSHTYSKAPKMVEETWGVEHRRGDGPKVTARSVLGTRRSRPAGSWYGSFIAQKNDKAVQVLHANTHDVWFCAVYELECRNFSMRCRCRRFQPKLRRGSTTTPTVPVCMHECVCVCMCVCAVWVFVGQNGDGKGDLPGRPRHTDSVSHDGTFHLQVQMSDRLFNRFERMFCSRAAARCGISSRLRS